MRELFDAVKAIIGHLVGRYENGLRLMLAPIVESLIIETFSFIIYVSIFVGNIAVYYAIIRNFDLGVIKHT
jgi:hypothetical protein